MRVDLSAPILDLAGVPAPDMTLGSVCTTALIAQYPDEPNLAGEEKAKRFALAVRFAAGGDIELSAEDVVMLKRLVGKAWSTLVVGRVWLMLDPVTVPDA